MKSKGLQTFVTHRFEASSRLFSYMNFSAPLFFLVCYEFFCSLRIILLFRPLIERLQFNRRNNRTYYLIFHKSCITVVENEMIKLMDELLAKSKSL